MLCLIAKLDDTATETLAALRRRLEVAEDVR